MAAEWYFEEEQDVNLEPLIHGPNYFHAALLLLISDFESRVRKYLEILDPESGSLSPPSFFVSQIAFGRVACSCWLLRSCASTRNLFKPIVRIMLSTVQ